MKQSLEDFIDVRAEQLAMVYLTRSQSLAIEHMSEPDCGLDILVTILRGKLPTGRMFGIQVKGRDRAFQDVQNIHREASLASPQPKRDYMLQDLPFPACLLLFTMEDDRGYCRWLKYSDRSNGNFDWSEESQWLSLDEYKVDRMIADVNAWYDQRNRRSHS